MKNIAILIAISKYDLVGNNLPGCEQDGRAIKCLLELSGKFQEIYYINGFINGSDAKSDIADLFQKYAGQEIGDIFFYFSGHGEYYNNEFYYLMSDYALERRKQSSLSNAEVDRMVRCLSPRMFVKIVDACHSGTPYIKDPSALENYLKSVGSSSFNNVCFMFSSQIDEFSYQNDSISYFTNSIISSIYTHKNGPIRYKNITDYVSDEFDQRNTQTPFFVDQANLTEIFLTVTDEIRTALYSFIHSSNNDNTDIGQHPQEIALSLVEILKRESKDFCTKEEADNTILKSEAYIHNGPFTTEIKELYEIEVDADSTSYPPQSASIGIWIEKNNDTREYFAKPIYEL